MSDSSESTPITIALFPRRTKPEGRLIQEPWEELSRRFMRHEIREEKDGPGFMPADLDPERVYRAAESVRALTLVVLDIDDETPLVRLQSRVGPYEYTAYTTHSHTKEAPKYRLVFPLARPVPPGEWRTVWAGAAALLAPGHVDPACKNVGRFYYLPACPPAARADRWSVRNPGTWLEPGGLAAAAPAPPQPPPARGGGCAPSGRGEYRTLDVVAWFTAHGMYGRPLGGGKHAVVCPWLDEHTQASEPEDSDTVVWEASGGRWPSKFCSHRHCEGRGIRQVMDLWGDADLFCAAEFPLPEPKPPPGDDAAPPPKAASRKETNERRLRQHGPAAADIEGWTARELLSLTIPPARYAVPGYISEGLTIFAGGQKKGKSWLAYGAAIAVAAGGVALGKIPVEQGRALYLALEDGPRRLQDRLRALLQGALPPEQLHLYHRWPSAPAGGIPALEDWLDSHPGTRLLVIDTLARFRGPRPPNGDIYQQDYDFGARLKRLADDWNLALLLLHHLSKRQCEDPFEQVSGSIGVTASADATLLLNRARGQDTARLFVTGRDVEEREMALVWHKQTVSWTLEGGAEEFSRSEERREILELLHERGPLAPKAIAEALGKNRSTIKALLAKMVGARELMTAEGLYWAPSLQ
jgi:hypothetical protein